MEISELAGLNLKPLVEDGVILKYLIQSWFQPHTEHSHTLEEMTLEHQLISLNINDDKELGGFFSLLKSRDMKGSAVLHRMITTARSQFPPPQPTMPSIDEKSFDVIIKVGARTFHAQRKSLMSCSPVFLNMFTNNYKENIQGVVNIRNMKESVFEEMLRYINTRCAPRIPNLEFAMDLLDASHLYGIEHLFYLSQNAASKYISPENIVSLYQFPEFFRARFLKDSCLIYILEHFKILWEEKGLAEFLSSIHEDIKKFVTRIIEDLP